MESKIYKSNLELIQTAGLTSHAVFSLHRESSIEHLVSSMQNEPNFPRYSPKNEDKAIKRTQYEPKRTQFLPNNKGDEPKRTQKRNENPCSILNINLS